MLEFFVQIKQEKFITFTFETRRDEMERDGFFWIRKGVPFVSQEIEDLVRSIIVSQHFPSVQTVRCCAVINSHKRGAYDLLLSCQRVLDVNEADEFHSMLAEIRRMMLECVSVHLLS